MPQQGHSIPFQINNDFCILRLLEIPPPLLPEFTSNNPKLSLKSPRGDSDASDKSTQAVLCTGNHTYLIRQVQSSNSVFFVQPSVSQDGDDEALPPSGLTAIAHCANKLELVPSASSAVTILRDLLPIFSVAEERDTDRSRHINPSPFGEGSTGTTGSIYENIPLSDGEVHLARKVLRAFEYDGQWWRPDSTTLIALWKSVVAAVDLRNIDLEAHFPISLLADTTEEDGLPRPLLDAVILGLSHGKKRPGKADEDVRPPNYELVLDQELCITWVGMTLLETRGSTAISTQSAKFLDEWRELLPEKWRKAAKLELLEGNTMQASGLGSFGVSTDGPSSSVNAGSVTADRKSSRKWHERFKNSRK